MKKLLLQSAIFCLLTVPVFSQIAFTPEVKRVAVFKNGYAFTYREGEAQTANGWAFTINAPIGVLGTVWGYSTAPNVRVGQLLATETEKRETARVADIAEVLLANEGAKIRFIDGSNKQFEGTYQLVGRSTTTTAPLRNEDGSISNLQLLENADENLIVARIALRRRQLHFRFGNNRRHNQTSQHQKRKRSKSSSRATSSAT